MRALNASLDRPWKQARSGAGAAVGKGADELWLARQLAPFGIRSRTMRIGDALGKGYVLADFTETFRRYIPQTELDRMDEIFSAPPPGEITRSSFG